VHQPRNDPALVRGRARADDGHAGVPRRRDADPSAGSTTAFTFLASRTGSYRFACLVPGHEEARMYDVLSVTSGGRPTISARAGP